MVVAGLVLASLMTPVSAVEPGGGGLSWAHGLGAGGTDQGLGLAVDAHGNVILTGDFSGTVDFDPGSGIHNLISGGSNDVFVAKFDAAGNLVWAHGFGAAGLDTGQSVTVDAHGNVIVTGYFSGTVDFDPGSGTHNLTSNGGSTDVFVVKLDSAGNLVWAHRFGTAAIDLGFGVAVDAHGNVTLTGHFEDTVDFDPGSGTHILNSNGSDDVFVVKLDPAGNLVWARGFGAGGSDAGQSVAVDAHGNVTLTGYFESTVDFDPGLGIHNLISGGSTDVFVVKLDSAGNLVWAHGFGAGALDLGFGVAVDAHGNVTLTGRFTGTVDFDPGPDPHNLTSSAGSTDAFVVKLDAAGNLVWAHPFGAAGADRGNSAAMDAHGNVTLTGRFTGTVDFDPGPDTHELTGNALDDAFVVKLDPAGNLVWAHGFGAAGLDVGFGVAVDAHGNVTVTGSFNLIVDFDPGSGVHNLTSGGDADVFVIKLTDAGVTRLAGANRFATAAAVSTHHHMLGAHSVFAATGANFPDALAGAAAAGTVAAPLLLTGSIPQATAEALDALDPAAIIILGGTAAVSAGDQLTLTAWAPITRLEGANRYDTAIAISQWAYPTAGSAEVVVIATGANFPDALAAAAAATALGGPVLLTPTASLPQAVITEIGRLDPALIIVAGGPIAVSDDVFDQLDSLAPTIRLAGANRYDTAVAISQHTFTNPALVGHLYIAVGTNFPDALAGAAAAATTGAPVLLTPTASLPQTVIDEITRLDPTRIYILGGTAVISQTVENQLTALLGI